MSTAPSLTITPTARLARQQQRKFAALQTEQGNSTWLTPAILSLPAWIERLKQDYFVDADDARTPIDNGQARILWQSLIARGVFIGDPEVADMAQRAWRRLHEYRLPAPATWDQSALSEDNRRFKDWACAYEDCCNTEQLVDDWAFATELPGLIATEKVPAPAHLTLSGFERPLPPLHQAILDALAAAGTQVTRSDNASTTAVLPAVTEYISTDDELTGAAQWARAELTAKPNQTLAIVVSDLSGRVAAVERTFRAVFDPPGFALRNSGEAIWHISLGIPLARWPLVTDALAALRLPHHRLTQPQAQRLLRSPFVGTWNEEQRARNAASAWLIRRAPFDLTMNELQHALIRHEARALSDQLNGWQSLRADHNQNAWPSQWSARLQQELSALAFARGRTLNSLEYQTLQRWHQLLDDFGNLDVVIREPVSRERALDLLQQRAAGSVFREQNTGVPIEILGVEEALGSTFDQVWITTLDRDTWPGPVRRDPLLPAALQTGLPAATSESALLQAQDEIQALCRTAPLIHGSYAAGTEEVPRAVTALLGQVPIAVAADVSIPAPAPMAQPLHDAQAPPFTGGLVGGGTAMLANQSDCPFKAFALRRLAAVDIAAPKPGLSPGQRGNVIHGALEHFWSNLNGSTELAGLPQQEHVQRVQTAVQSALDDLTAQFRLTLSSAGRALEQQRCERALFRWLQIEQERPPFTVLAREQEVDMHFAGLQLRGKIDRLDRLADQSVLLIDYKTGAGASREDWMPQPRIRNPQLPAYAVSMDPPPAALAFARIRPGDVKFNGLSAEQTDTAGIAPLAAATRNFKAAHDWNALLEDWRSTLQNLAEQFIRGDAAVDPRESAVCRNCHLQALCRISERAPFVDDPADTAGD